MTQRRPARSPVPEDRPAGSTARDHLAQRITAALRSREPDAADTAAAARRIAARLAAPAHDPSGVMTPFVRRAGRITVTGVVASGIAVAGAGAAAAANPYSPFAVAVEDVAHAVGVEWSAMPTGYTREQYDAFWNAGYTTQDVAALADLWNTDATAAKARAGQLLLDGAAVPVAPGSSGSGLESSLSAFSGAGYTFEDAEVLAELWQVEVDEAKIRAGTMLLDGERPPLP